jgi:hypothetical protein
MAGCNIAINGSLNVTTSRCCSVKCQLRPAPRPPRPPRFLMAGSGNDRLQHQLSEPQRYVLTVGDSSPPPKPTVPDPLSTLLPTSLHVSLPYPSSSSPSFHPSRPRPVTRPLPRPLLALSSPSPSPSTSSSPRPLPFPRPLRPRPSSSFSSVLPQGCI